METSSADPISPPKSIILSEVNKTLLSKTALTKAIGLASMTKPIDMVELQMQDTNDSRQLTKPNPPPLHPLQMSPTATNLKTVTKGIKSIPGLGNINIVKTVNGRNKEKTQELMLMGKLVKDLGSHSIEFNKDTLNIIKEFTLGIQFLYSNKIRSLRTHVEYLKQECKDKSERISALNDTLNDTMLKLYAFEEEKKLSDVKIHLKSDGFDGWLKSVNSLGSKFLADIEQSCKHFLSVQINNMKTDVVSQEDGLQSIGNTEQDDETIDTLIIKLIERMGANDVSLKQKHHEQLNTLFEKLQPMINLDSYVVSDVAIDRICESNMNNILVNDVNMGVELNIPQVQTKNQYMSNEGTQPGIFLVQDFIKYLLNCMNEHPDSGVQLHQDVVQNDLQEVKKQCIAFKFLMHSIDVYDVNHQTPLHRALTSDTDPEIFYTLLRNKANLALVDCEGNNSLHLAIEHDTLEKLLHRSVHPLIPESVIAKMINVLNGEGYAPLHLAAMNGKPEHVEWLLEMRANINLTDKKSGRTALYHAVERNAVEIASILKKYNADIFVTTYAGLTIVDNLVDNETDYSDEMKKLFYTDRMLISSLRKKLLTPQEKRVNRNKLRLEVEAKKRKIV